VTIYSGGKYRWCADRHLHYEGDECPRAALHSIPGPITNYNSAKHFIEWQLATVHGDGEKLPTHSWSGACRDRGWAVASLAARIVHFAGSELWGPKLRDKYAEHPEIGPYIAHLEQPDEPPPDGVDVFKVCPAASYGWFENRGPVSAKPGIGHNQPPEGRLTREQAELVWKHDPKIKKEARKYACGNDIIRDELLSLGMERVIKLAAEFDPAKGVTFGKFLEKYLWGFMRDHAARMRKFISGVDENALDLAYFGGNGRKVTKGLSERDSKKAKWSKHDRRTGEFYKGERVHSVLTREGRRQSLAGMKERWEASGGSVKVKEAPIKVTAELLAAARLNKRQELVLEEYEKGSPVAAIARRIGNLEGKTIDETQVSRIRRQADRKLKAALDKTKSVR
jgi:Sigma-70 region 2